MLGESRSPYDLEAIAEVERRSTRALRQREAEPSLIGTCPRSGDLTAHRERQITDLRIARRSSACARLAGEANHRIAGATQSIRSEEHTSELQSLRHLVCRLLLEKKNKKRTILYIAIKQ